MAIRVDYINYQVQSSNTAPSNVSFFPYDLVKEALDLLVQMGEKKENVIHCILEAKKQSDAFEKTYERRVELKEQKEHWRGRLSEFQQESFSFYLKLEEDFKKGTLIPVASGAGGAYFLADEAGVFQFVIKPVDEDIACLNNRKGNYSYESPERGGFRYGIPLYRSHQTDTLVSRVSEKLGVQEITPKTLFWICESNRFFDRIDGFKELTEEQRRKYMEKAGFPDKEKLVVVQEFVPDSQDFFEWHHEILQQYNKLEKEGIISKKEAEEAGNALILKQLDFSDVEKTSILMWVSNETDGHAGNMRVYQKNGSNDGPLFGIKKVDNDLSFPEMNGGLFNSLIYLPQGNMPLSLEAKQIIKNIPTLEIVEEMKMLEMEKCIPAFLERVQMLQLIAQQEGITLKEIDAQLRLMGDGK